MIGGRRLSDTRPVRFLLKPARAVVGSFAVVALLGTGLLMLPISSESRETTNLVPALFTAVSAECVTGLIVVDTPTHWSTFGELVILGLIQVGGIGIMTMASLLGILVIRRIGLRMQLTAQTETKALRLGEVRGVIRRVLLLSLTIEALVAVPLTLRFAITYDESAGRATYLGIFHAISAFNNAGFSLYTNSLIGFETDPWICLPIVAAVILGGIGFPVLLEVGRHFRSLRQPDRTERWSLHVKITVLAYGALLVVGVVGMWLTEWRNPDTLGRYGVDGKLLAGFFHGVMPRTAGFNSLDVGQFESTTLLSQEALMFIGGGSAGTAGGIKVTTFILLAFVILAEIRGEPTVHVMGRRLPADVQRQALTVALLSVALVIGSTLALLAISDGLSLDEVLFECVSAFGTVGLSTGITADLPDAGQVLLTILMFAGRLGPITLASALALREHARRYEYPEERPIVG